MICNLNILFQHNYRKLIIITDMQINAALA